MGNTGFSILEKVRCPVIVSGHVGSGLFFVRKDNVEHQTCRGDHSGHLCVLASREKFDEIKTPTRNQRYIYFNCGRVTDCDDNLCNPMPLVD